MDSDEQLIQRMRKGDDTAIEEFVRKYYPMIMSYCQRRLQDTCMAEDLTQETFERFFRNFSSYRHHGKALNYLYTIAGNLCKNLYPSICTEISVDETDNVKIKDGTVWDDSKNADGDGRDPASGIAERVDMERALKKLPEIYREVMVLHYYHDLRLKDIAAVLNIGLPTVKYRIHRGKKLLREILGEEESHETDATERRTYTRDN